MVISGDAVFSCSSNIRGTRKRPRTRHGHLQLHVKGNSVVFVKQAARCVQYVDGMLCNNAQSNVLQLEEEQPSMVTIWTCIYVIVRFPNVANEYTKVCGILFMYLALYHTGTCHVKYVSSYTE